MLQVLWKSEACIKPKDQPVKSYLELKPSKLSRVLTIQKAPATLKSRTNPKK